MAKAVRARRALPEAALRGRRRTDANADGARADAPMSDEQIAGVAACLNRHESNTYSSVAVLHYSMARR